MLPSPASPRACSCSTAWRVAASAAGASPSLDQQAAQLGQGDHAQRRVAAAPRPAPRPPRNAGARPAMSPYRRAARPCTSCTMTLNQGSSMFSVAPQRPRRRGGAPARGAPVALDHRQHGGEVAALLAQRLLASCTGQRGRPGCARARTGRSSHRPWPGCPGWRAARSCWPAARKATSDSFSPFSRCAMSACSRYSRLAAAPMPSWSPAWRASASAARAARSRSRAWPSWSCA